MNQMFGEPSEPIRMDEKAQQGSSFENAMKIIEKWTERLAEHN